MRRLIVVAVLAFGLAFVAGCNQPPPPEPAAKTPAPSGADPAVEQPGLIIPLPVDPDRPRPPPPGPRELDRQFPAP